MFQAAQAALGFAQANPKSAQPLGASKRPADAPTATYHPAQSAPEALALAKVGVVRVRVGAGATSVEDESLVVAAKTAGQACSRAQRAEARRAVLPYDKEEEEEEV